MFDIHKEIERWTVVGDLESLLEIIEEYIESEGLNPAPIEEIKEGLVLKNNLLKCVESLRELALRISEEVEEVEDCVEHMP